MAEIFADTSAWGNLYEPTEPYYQLATTIYRKARRQRTKLVTTNYVLAELVALMTSPLGFSRPSIVKLIDGLKTSPFVEIVHVDAPLDADAWKLLQSRLDKEWSLVDCASFVLMDQRQMTEALTSDHHFEQAGFVRLLK